MCLNPVGKRSGQNVISYVPLQRRKMECMSDIVQQNVEKARSQQKRWYDRNTSEWTLQSEDQVLVTSAMELTAQWQGFYRMLNAVGKSIMQSICMIIGRKINFWYWLK